MSFVYVYIQLRSRFAKNICLTSKKNRQQS